MCHSLPGGRPTFSSRWLENPSYKPRKEQNAVRKELRRRFYPQFGLLCPARTSILLLFLHNNTGRDLETPSYLWVKWRKSNTTRDSSVASFSSSSGLLVQKILQWANNSITHFVDLFVYFFYFLYNSTVQLMQFCFLIALELKKEETKEPPNSLLRCLSDKGIRGLGRWWHNVTPD